LLGTVKLGSGKGKKEDRNVIVRGKRGKKEELAPTSGRKERGGTSRGGSAGDHQKCGKTKSWGMSDINPKRENEEFLNSRKNVETMKTKEGYLSPRNMRNNLYKKEF